jgi:hypothetical protein
MLKEIAERTKIDRMGRTFHRKVIVCSCDACEKTYEKPYYTTMNFDALTFCSRKCLWQSKKSGLLAEKARKTLLEKYGVENLSQSPAVQEKIRKNSLEKYGVEHHTKSEGFKEKERRRRVEKFGVEHHWMLDEVKQKRKETWCQNYGTDNPGAAEEIKDKIRQTFQQNYGVDNPFAAEEIKEKIAETNIERYGFRNPSQCDYILRKQVESFVGMDYDYYYNEYLPAFESYRRKVWAVTKKQPLETLENFDKRGRGNNGYHVDHIVSISDGFKNNIEPEVIGHIKNLRMLLGRENISKGPRSDMEINELLEMTGAQDEVDN